MTAKHWHLYKVKSDILICIVMMAWFWMTDINILWLVGLPLQFTMMLVNDKLADEQIAILQRGPR